MYCLLLTSCSFCDSIITQIYTPGAFGIRLRYEYARSGSHGSSLFVNESSTTTHPALAPLSHLHPDMAYAKPMTSVTSSLAKRAGLPLCPPQYPSNRRSSASSLTLIRTLSHSSCRQARPSRQHGLLRIIVIHTSLCTSLSTPPVIRYRGVSHSEHTGTWYFAMSSSQAMEKRQERPFVVRDGNCYSDFNPTNSNEQLTNVQPFVSSPASSAPCFPLACSRVCSYQCLQQCRNAASRHGNVHLTASINSFLFLYFPLLICSSLQSSFVCAKALLHPLPSSHDKRRAIFHAVHPVRWGPGSPTQWLEPGLVVRRHGSSSTFASMKTGILRAGVMYSENGSEVESAGEVVPKLLGIVTTNNIQDKLSRQKRAPKKRCRDARVIRKRR